MPERNVLVIAYYFPPMGLSGVQRTLKFVKYLTDYGWNPIVLTTDSSPFYAFDESLTEELESSNIKVFRTPADGSIFSRLKKNKLLKFPSYFTQKIGRFFLQFLYQPDSRIKWKKPAIKLAEEIISENRIDVIFATAPPFTDFLIAREISKLYKIPFVVDYRDVWVDNPFHVYPTPIHKFRNINMERDILTHAKRAIVTTRYSKELLLKRYGFVSHSDIVIIPHGYDPEDFIGFEDVKPNAGKFTITHSGLFQDDRTPKYFLKALSNFLQKNKEAASVVEARFVGIMRKKHLKMVKKYSLQNNVVTTGYLPHREAVRHLLESDVLWLTLNDTVRSPGKLYEYFGTGKPLLICSPEGVIRRTALETKAAIATDPKDIKAIEEALDSFYKLWKIHNLPVQNKEYTSQFDRSKLAGDLARELAMATEII